MALLPILEFPDPRLRTRAQPVEHVDASLRKLVDDMFETMYAAPGIGLAATQVNVHKRLLVIDVSENRSEPRVFINPEILSREGVEETEEGCLSVPGVYDKVTRADRIRVRALDRDGQVIRDGRRRTARRLHPARDRSSRRQAVRRLPVRAEAHANSKETREGAQGSRASRLSHPPEGAVATHERPVLGPIVGDRPERPSIGPRLKMNGVGACRPVFKDHALMASYSVIFAGTPEFSVPALEALLASQHRVVAAYTQPDRPAGRGRRVAMSAVKECAIAPWDSRRATGLVARIRCAGAPAGMVGRSHDRRGVWPAPARPRFCRRRVWVA